MKEHERIMYTITALLADEIVLLGQIRVESNEIPACRELIELLNMKKAVLTMDLIYYQKKIVKSVYSII